jgi:hypothetical protein
MSHRLIALSPDLQKLRSEGFDIEARGDRLLLVKDVPYVNAKREVKLGTLVSKLQLQGDLTVPPTDHVAFWIGEHPCHSNGAEIATFKNSSTRQDLGDGVMIDHTFSAKAQYRDYPHKMTTYIGRITGEAQRLEPKVTAQTFPVVEADHDEPVFKYAETASVHAGIAAANAKLALGKVGIVGLGGTGSYVLDMVAKTPAREIYLFDADSFHQHNAFRAPSAASIEELRAKPTKVGYLAALYSKMRRGIVPVAEFVDESNIDKLKQLDFTFVCIDQGAAKRLIVKALEECGRPFIDVGMGVVQAEGKLSGLVRVSTSTAENRELARRHIGLFDADDAANDYSTNIQIAELNALNAALAVVRWKKLYGFYHDRTNDYYAGYSVAAGDIVTEPAS